MSLEDEFVDAEANLRSFSVAEPEPDCPDCGDSGWKRVEDGGAGIAVRCGCRSPATNADLAKRRLRHAGLEAEEILSAWASWDETLQPKPLFASDWLFWALRDAQEACPASCWAGTPRRPPRSPWSLCLLGLPGRGKTKVAATLARLYVEAGGSGLRWARTPEAFDTVQGERRLEGSSPMEKAITLAPLLVLDELGVGHRRDPETMTGTVDEWLAARERRRLPTVLTTNAQGIDALDARIASRLSAGVYREMASETDARDR